MTIFEDIIRGKKRYDPNNQLVMFYVIFRSRIEAKMKIIG